MIKEICRFFWELGEVYTMTDWLREIREIDRRNYETTKAMHDIFVGLVLR